MLRTVLWPSDSVHGLIAVTGLALLLVAVGTTGASALGRAHAPNHYAETVPSFDVRSMCRGAIDPGVETASGCAADEHAARDQLVKTWLQYPAAERADCIASMPELPSYVELQVCLQMTRDAENERAVEASGTPPSPSVSIPAGSGDYVPPPLPSDLPPTSTPPVVQPYKPPSITTFSDRVNNAIQSYPLQRDIGNNPIGMQSYIRQQAN
jgi:hypothetical protein